MDLVQPYIAIALKLVTGMIGILVYPLAELINR